MTFPATIALVFIAALFPVQCGTAAAQPVDGAFRQILNAEPIPCNDVQGCYCAVYNRSTPPPSAAYARARACPSSGGKIGFTAWDTFGNKVDEGEFMGSRRTGAWTSWHPNGARAAEVRFASGKQTGPFKAWHANGKLAVVGQYLDGKQNGTWLHYNPNGSLKNRQAWENGVLRHETMRK
jgi:hypothetical protein